MRAGLASCAGQAGSAAHSCTYLSTYFFGWGMDLWRHPLQRRRVTPAAHVPWCIDGRVGLALQTRTQQAERCGLQTAVAGSARTLWLNHQLPMPVSLLLHGAKSMCCAEVCIAWAATCPAAARARAFARGRMYAWADVHACMCHVKQLASTHLGGQDILGLVRGIN